MKTTFLYRGLAILLAICMSVQMAPPVMTASKDERITELSFEQNEMELPSSLDESVIAGDAEEETPYEADDIVRVSIVLDEESTLEAGFDVRNLTENSAMRYRQAIQDDQNEAVERIEEAIDDDLAVVWNLTLAANLISANIRYEQIETIEEMEGIGKVVIENRYEPAVASVDRCDPAMATSSDQIGSSTVYEAGYYGAGSRIAVIDTGIDTDHQSFDADSLEYALNLYAEENGLSAEKYLEELDLLDEEEINSVLDQLNIKYVRTNQLYRNSKIPFAYNYVDMDYDVTHDNDSSGEHGSHVAGIAAANAYISDGEGGKANALDSVRVQGVAPDAQIIAMKVFGKNGGAYDSDYMAAIEDAIVLGADVINLSLGSSYPGFSNATEEYQSIMDTLEESGVVVAVAAGNAYNWASYTNSGTGYLYGEDVSLDTVGAPASFTNTLSVASVDNSGFTGYYFTVGETKICYTEDAEAYSNSELTTIAGEHEYILTDGIGQEEEFEALADVLEGRIAVCSRGTTTFVSKAENAVKYGAIATIVYNNQDGTFNMDLTDYQQTEPVVSITQKQGNTMRENAEAVFGGDGTVLYYKGTLYISSEIASGQNGLDYDTMSEFSSWGVPGSLELKPEITAPGGNIYSVDGSKDSGDAYENMSGTSMASPQIAGMAALLMEHIKKMELEDDAVSIRYMTQSLLMSTAVPITEEKSGNPYSVMSQGAGLANIGKAISANSLVMMDEGASSGASDGKVKVELGDDPERTGLYSFGFTIKNFSDEELAYTLSGDFFTQDLFTDEDGVSYLDTSLTALPADITWSVDGETFVPRASAECDLDLDGDTDAYDAQIILEYCAGNVSEIDRELADLDGDGQVSTYDAHLLLAGMETASFGVKAGESVHVTAEVQISEQTRAFLNQRYINGAYVEGYVYMEPVSTEEGEVPDVTHSVPVLGFYGNWTDASMFDHAEYADGIYETGEYIPYADTYRNVLTLRYAGDSTAYYQIGNPYRIEEEYPEERLAISSSTVLYRYSFGLIRNASALAAVITNDDGDILYLGPISNQVNSAYYAASAQAWQYTTATYTLNQRVSGLGAEEGERIHVSLVAVPEYYETNGSISEAELKNLITSGTLGSGAYLTTAMTVDNTAPRLEKAAKDLNTGNLLLTVSDNQYVANVEVRNQSGATVYASALPEQTEAGQSVEVELALQDTGANGELVVVISDYANNQLVYTVNYGEKTENYSGSFIAFTSSDTRGSGNRWIEIDPDSLYYSNDSDFGGTEDYAFTGLDVIAAEYVGGYVYMACSDGYIYVAELGHLANVMRAGKYSDSTATIRDMAYNYADGKLYALGDVEGTTSATIRNIIWSIDLTTGKMTKEYTIGIVNPNSTSKNYKRFVNMTIDDEGNFYAVTFGSGKYNFLYTWNGDDAVDGTISDLQAVNHTDTGAIGYTAQIYGGSMAWDHDNDVLYWLNNSTNNGNGADTQYLLVVDTDTGKASPANENAVMYNTTAGLFIVPDNESSAAPPVGLAQAIELNCESVSLPKGASYQLTASVYPWTLSDKTVTWSSSDTSIATVEDGLVYAVSDGEAVITATTNAEPGYTASCTVTVTELEGISLSGLVYSENRASWAEFSTDSLESWTETARSDEQYVGGTLLEGMLYVHDGKNLYQVDPDTFETTCIGKFSASWLFADAAAAPETDDGKFGCIVAPCMGGIYIELLYPEEGSLSYFDVSQTFSADPLATMTLAGYVEEDYEFQDWTNMVFETYEDCPVYIFYGLTESGALWQIKILGYGDENGFSISYEKILDTGIDLAGVPEMDGSRYASTLYDSETERLLLAIESADGESCFYSIDSETGLASDMGSLGTGVAVTALYQYTRVTELTVRISRTHAELFEGETLELSARVLPAQYKDQVIWSSSDPEVASVDEDGTVTALQDGTAVIQVVSADKDESGETASASCVVTVTGMADLSTEVKAQVIVEDGRILWVTMDTADIQSFTMDAVADTYLSGGGSHEGKIYGSDSNYIVTSYYYEVDPDQEYSENQGETVSVSNSILDAASAPAAEVTAVGDGGEQYSASAFGGAAYVSYGKSFTILTDYTTGSRAATSFLGSSSDFAAIAYVGMEIDENGNPVEEFLALGAGGKLYLFNVTAEYVLSSWGNYINYTLTKTEYADLKHTFTSSSALTMTYVNDGENEGLVIGENQKNEVVLWYINLQASEPDCRKLDTLIGAKAISCLFTDSAAIGNRSSYRIYEGTASANSSLISMSGDGIAAALMDSGIPETEEGMAETESVEEVETAAEPEEVEIAAEWKAEETLDEREAGEETMFWQRTDEGKISVTIRLSEDSANGLYRISYDPAVLTYVSTVSPMSNYAVYTEKGTIVFDYAAKDKVSEGTVAAILEFTPSVQVLDTSVVVNVSERNDQLKLSEEWEIPIAYSFEGEKPSPDLTDETNRGENNKDDGQSETEGNTEDGVQSGTSAGVETGDRSPLTAYLMMLTGALAVTVCVWRRRRRS